VPSYRSDLTIQAFIQNEKSQNRIKIKSSFASMDELDGGVAYLLVVEHVYTQQVT
jgi:hypothetical protein